MRLLTGVVLIPAALACQPTDRSPADELSQGGGAGSAASGQGGASGGSGGGERGGAAGSSGLGGSAQGGVSGASGLGGSAAVGGMGGLGGAPADGGTDGDAGSVQLPELLAHWPLDGDALDYSGNGLHAVEGPNIAYTTGVLGQAAWFNGSTTYLRADEVPFAGAGSYSVSFWFSARQDLNSWRGYVLTHGNLKSNNLGWSAFFASGTSDDGRLNLRVNGNEAANQRAAIGSPSAIAKDTWRHVVFVIDREEGKLQGYLDGVASDWVAGGSLSDGDDSIVGFDEIQAHDPLTFGVGARRGALDGFFDGLIDDVRVYRGALKPEQVAAVAGGAGAGTDPSGGGGGAGGQGGTGGSGGAGDEPLPAAIAHWPLDGSAEDASGNDFDGTENGPVTYEPGKLGSAAVFNGFSSFIRVEGSVPQPQLDNFSVTLWVKRAQSGAVTSPQSPIGHGNQFSSQAGWALTLLSQGNNRLVVRSTSPDSPQQRVSRSSPVLLDDTQWHHVALVIDRTLGHIFGYLDGEYWGWLLGGGGPGDDWFGIQGGVGAIVASEPLLIGATQDGSTVDSHFHGSVDDVRLYDQALSSAQIQRLAAID